MRNPVALYNMGESVYTEKYQDETITIKPKQFIKMNRSDAIALMGKVSGTDPRTGHFTEKNLEMRPILNETVNITGQVDVEQTFKCMACGKTFENQKTLDDHLKSHAGQAICEEHVCDICNKVFDSNRAMISHKRYHKDVEKVEEQVGA